MALVESLVSAGMLGNQARLLGDWTPADGPFFYSSTTAISGPSDLTTRFQIGDRLRVSWDYGVTWKYFYVVGVASTLLTVAGGTDYSVTNAAITNVESSRLDLPFKFPGIFNWTPVPYHGTMGYTSQQLRVARFSVKGRTCFFELNVTGTIVAPVAGYLLIPLPVPCVSNASFYRICGMAQLFQATYTSGSCMLINNQTANMYVQRTDLANFAAGALDIYAIGSFEI